MDILELTKKVISFKSTSYHEMELAQYISSLLNTKNIPHILDVYNPGDYLNKTGMQNSANVVVPVGSGEETLILYAHIDVVNGPEKLFQPWVEEGHLFGRGASDMKASLAGLLYVLLNNYETLKRSNKKIVFAFIADEETSATGIRRFIDTLRHVHLQKAQVVLMEPTDDFSFIEHGGRGYAFLDLQGSTKDIMKTLYTIKQAKSKILKQYPDMEDGFGEATIEITKVDTKDIRIDETIDGVACHASRPHQGLNPVEKALELFNNVTAVSSSKDSGPNAIASYAKIEKGQVKGENRQCFAHVDLRLNRAASENHVMLNEVLHLIPPSVKVDIRDKGQAFLNQNEKLYHICTDGVADGIPKTIAIGGSDAPYLAEYTQNIISGFGPGQLKWCHKDDERVNIAVLRDTPDKILQIIKNYLDS